MFECIICYEEVGATWFFCHTCKQNEICNVCAFLLSRCPCCRGEVYNNEIDLLKVEKEIREQIWFDMVSEWWPIENEKNKLMAVFYRFEIDRWIYDIRREVGWNIKRILDQKMEWIDELLNDYCNIGRKIRDDFLYLSSGYPRLRSTVKIPFYPVFGIELTRPPKIVRSGRGGPIQFE